MPRTKSGVKYVQATKKLIARYIRGRKSRRLHITNEQTGFKQPEKPPICEMKPEGMWYGFGDSWMSWVMSEVDGSWLQPYVYEVIPKEGKVLRITNEEEFEAFEDKFWGFPEHMREQMDRDWKFRDLMMPNHYGMRFINYIDWKRVAEVYCGLEITPYLWEKRLESMWYYGWDCESGVIWHKDGIKEVRLFAEYDEGLDEFRRVK